MHNASARPNRAHSSGRTRPGTTTRGPLRSDTPNSTRSTGSRNTSGSRQSGPSGGRGRRTFTGGGSSSGYGGRSGGQGRGGFGGRSPQKRGRSSFDPSQFINTNPVDVQAEEFSPIHTFEEFGLADSVTRAIKAMGITSPSPIQDRIIPHILRGADVIGLAETGTGKTAAFLAPLITNTVNGHRQTTLILAPTRELALQIDAELKKLSRGVKLHSTVCVGGTGMGPQIRGLRSRNEFIIGTPGRILDLIRQKYFHPEFVTNVVLDEADRMLDMGFIHDMRTILSHVPEKRQMLLFSATMSPEMNRIVQDFLREPVQVSVKKKDTTDSIAQDVVRFEHAAKYDTLVELLAQPEFRRVIIFGAMKHSVERLAKELVRSGVRAESIHGNKSHGQRQYALTKFKNGGVQVLVATDVAARGIHVDDVSHVINYDLPNSKDDYIHRIGRTGRGSKRGKALTFIPR